MICSALIISGTMELVAMELKQSGYFLARTLSYEASLLLCRPATSLPMSCAHQYALQGIWIGRHWALKGRSELCAPCNRVNTEPSLHVQAGLNGAAVCACHIVHSCKGA